MSVQHTPRERILTRPMVMGMLVNFGALTSFYLLMSVMPLYAADAGAGDGGAGLAMGVMMLGTVLAELGLPRLLARRGYRTTLALGLLLLGIPPLVLLPGGGLPAILAVCLARGAGLGVVVVAATTLVAELVPPARRGEGLGLSGVMASVPSIAGLPLGLWITQAYGYGPVLVAAAVTAGLPLLALAGVPATRPPHTRRRRGLSIRGLSIRGLATRRLATGGLATGGIARPATVFFAVTMATGVIMTFLPLAVAARTLPLLPAAMLAQSVATPIARWWAGRYGDRRGPSPLLLPAVVATAAGTALLAAADSPAALFTGMTVFGIGFGIAQNATLTLMLSRVPRSGYSRISALWNLAYDGGMGAGAAGFGLVAAHTGYPVGFALTAAVVLATLAPAVRDRSATAQRPAQDDTAGTPGSPAEGPAEGPAKAQAGCPV